MKRPKKIVLLAVLPLMMLISSAHALRLPDSGQTKCYDSDGNEINCPASGQDGAYAFNAMSFADNGDGTVTDNVTDLMWQKGDPSPQQYNWFQASGTYDATHNPTTMDVCGSQSLGGVGGWRLPTKKELTTIADYSIPSPGPTINQSYFPYAAAKEYWTIDSGAQNSDYAWLVQFSDGQIFAAQTYFSFGLAPAHYVRCVRGAIEPVSLTDNQDGTVTDNRTGLMWQRNEGGTMKWDAALSHCEGLSLANHNDWRLPNIKELESLTDDTLYNPALNRTFFPGAVAGNYWSSTSAGGYIEGNVIVWPLAWAVDFFSGSVDSRAKANFDYNVRCVRGQSGDFARLMRGGNTVTSFKSLQDAYDAALNGDTILARAQDFHENLAASEVKSITLTGGYDFDFIMKNGVTTLNGVLNIEDGVFTVGNLVIR